MVKVNLMGVYRKGIPSPLWVMTNLDPQKGMKIYQKRMQFDGIFWDLIDLLRLKKLMNKSQRNLEKMIALTKIAYVVGASFGEAVRDVPYRKMFPDQVQFTLLDGSYQTVQQKVNGTFILVYLFIPNKSPVYLTRSSHPGLYLFCRSLKFLFVVIISRLLYEPQKIY